MEFAKLLPVAELLNLPRKLSQLTAVITLLVGSAWLGMAHASSTVELGTGKVSVDNKSSRALSNGTRAALEQLLVKITGQQDISDYQTVDAIRRNANRRHDTCQAFLPFRHQSGHSQLAHNRCQCPIPLLRPYRRSVCL